MIEFSYKNQMYFYLVEIRTYYVVYYNSSCLDALLKLTNYASSILSRELRKWQTFQCFKTMILIITEATHWQLVNYKKSLLLRNCTSFTIFTVDIFINENVYFLYRKLVLKYGSQEQNKTHL